MKPAIQDNIFETLRQYVDSANGVLSPAHERILNRWNFAYDQLKVESHKDVVNRIIKKFKVSYATANSDINNAKKLWRPINRVDCDWWLSFLLEDAKKQMTVAAELGDQKAWTDARNSATKLLIPILNSQGAIDPDKLGGNRYYLNLVQNNQVVKLDLDKMDVLPEGERNDIIDVLFSDVTDVETMKKIMSR